QTALTTAQQSVAQQEPDVTTKTSAFNAAAQTQAAAAKALETAQADLQQKQQIAASVAEAVAKTDLALQKLPGDADLTIALDKLKTRLAPLADNAKSAESVVTTRQSEHQSATSVMQAARQQLDASTTELSNRKKAVEEQTAAVAKAQADAQATHSAAQSVW